MIPRLIAWTIVHLALVAGAVAIIWAGSPWWSLPAWLLCFAYRRAPRYADT